MARHRKNHGRGRRYEIRPTSPREIEEGRYTDISLSNLFGAHVTQINSVRQAIWARYTAMLIANSVLSAFTSSAALPLPQRLAGPVAGLLLCGVWLAILVRDWIL